MKKMILSLVLAIMGVTGCFAQTDLVATLSHGTSLSTFIGDSALVKAHAAAVEGDVITLSPGVFKGTTINKAITLRGAGMNTMESNGYTCTQISGAFTINVPSNTSSTLTFEGVNALGVVSINGNNLAPINFNRNRFNAGVTGYGVSMTAFSCVFASGLRAQNNEYGVNNLKNTTLNCYNCVICYAGSDGYVRDNVIGKIQATNCVVTLEYTSVGYSTFTNCIIVSSNNNDNYPLPQTCSAQNCIGINSKSTPNVFQNIENSSNVMIEGTGSTAFKSVFKTLGSLVNNPAINETFELTDEAAATYLGDDGTQVGIYGGPNPFDPTPMNPQIKKFTVESSNSNGKLSVKIKVE